VSVGAGSDRRGAGVPNRNWVSGAAKLLGRLKISSQIAGAIKAVAGVVDVQTR
jgi:hypothetical protein